MEPATFMKTPSPRDATSVEAMTKRTGKLLLALGYLGTALGLLAAVLIAVLSDPRDRLGTIVLAVVVAAVIAGPFALAASIGLGRTRRLWRDGTLVTGSLRSAGMSLAASVLANGPAVYELSVEFQLGTQRFLATSSASVDPGPLQAGHPIPLLVLASNPGKVILCTGLPGGETLEGSCKPILQ